MDLTVSEDQQAGQALHRQLEELRVIYAVATAGAEATNVDQLVERATQIIGDTFYPDNFGLLLVDEGKMLLRHHPSYRRGSKEKPYTGIPLGQGVTGLVAATGIPLRIPDVSCEPVYIQADHQTRSELCVPLKIGDRVIGVINAESSQLDAFAPSDERLLSILAGQLATAIDRLKAEAAERRRADQLAILYQASQDIVASLEPQQIYSAVHRAASGLMSCDAFVITILDEAAQEIDPVYLVDRDQMIQAARIPSHRGLSGYVIATGKSLHIGSPDQLKDIDAEWAGETGETRSILAVPITLGGKVFGMLSAQSYLPDAYSPDDLTSLWMLANQVGIALSNARLFEETRRRTAHLEALNGIILAAASALDLQDLLGVALDHTLHALNLEMGGIWAAGKSVIRHMDRFQVRASLTVPILAAGRRIGELSLASSVPRIWPVDEIALIEGVGRQLGGAIERMQLLEKIQAHALQVQQIMDSVPDGVLLLDENRRVVLANPAAEEHLSVLHSSTGNAPITMLGDKPLGDYLDPTEFGVWHDLRVQDSPGKMYELAVQPLLARQNSGGWVLVLRDVTQERENQTRIQIQERLATVGQLAAGIAHDFNNILAAIVVYADLLKRDPSLPSASRERLAIIHQQVQRAASLIRQILDFSRRSMMEHSTLDVLPFLKELDKLLRRLLPETIRVELRYRPGRYQVVADPTRLQQVFMNLAVNARDAMPVGGVLHFEMARLVITPKTHPCPNLHPGHWIRISVSDTGFGIAPDVLPHIFEPFFTTKPIGQGTGLGLAQAYGIIKQHGGHIEVESRQGEGTTFHVFLPALEASDQYELLPEQTLELDGEGETILVVEDDAVARQAMSDLLKAYNYRVLVAADGVEALDLFNQRWEDIALVVSDIVMPEMGGVDLYYALRQRWPQVKMLFVTGHPLREQDQAILERGEVNWLQKPYAIQTFHETIRQLINGSE